MSRVSMLMLIWLCLTGAVQGASVSKLYVPYSVGNNATAILGIESAIVINQFSSNFEIGLAVANADSSEVWLFGDHSNYCNVVTTVSDRLLRTFDAGVIAAKACFSPDGKYCFAIGRAADKPNPILMAIDRGTYEALYAISGFGEPAAATVAQDSRFLYVASRSDGVVAKVAIPSFQIVKLIAVGQEPIDMQMSSDGQLLFVLCQGLASGKRGGAQLVVVDVSTDRPTWIHNDIGRAPVSLAIDPAVSRMVITYAEPQTRPQANVRIFHLDRNGDQFEFTPAGGFLHGAAPSNGVIAATANLWLGADHEAGLARLDLTDESTESIPDVIRAARPRGVAVVRIDVDARIAELQSNMAAMLEATEVADSYLDLAYLHSTAGRTNDVVASYNKVISSFPQSLAAIIAGLRMSDITHREALYAQSAEYGLTALQNYAEYLTSAEDRRTPPQNDVLVTIDRVALYAKESKRDYLKQLAERFLKISAQNSQLPEVFYDLGYQLHLQGDSKLAKRCFVEAQNRIGAIQDRMAMLTLSAKLALVNGDAAAIYRLRERRDPPVIDGLIDEWQKTRALALSGDGGYVYGPALWTGVNDLSASLYFAVTRTDLLIAGNILDNALVSFTGGQGDGINVFIDLRPESASLFTRKSDWGDGCFKITIDAPTATIPKARLRMSTDAGYEIGSVTSTAGYTFEARIPLAAFGQWYNSNIKSFGLGVEILDYDLVDSPTLMKALGFLQPTRDPGAAPDPLLFGLIER